MAGDFPHTERLRDTIRRVVETGKPQTIEMQFVDSSTGQTILHQVCYAPEWGSGAPFSFTLSSKSRSGKHHSSTEPSGLRS